MTSKILLITSICFSLVTGAGSPFGPAKARAQGEVSFQVFYDQLSPYGSWVDYPNYGYVWIPAGREGFRPYGTRGHWIYTEDGWTWVSDYSWGWATFHYGNWFYDDAYGWMWAPGYEWAPAWVTWGESGGNYCWAPIGPRIDIGVAYGTYRPPYNYWNFCPRDRITSVNVSNYYVNNSRNRTVVNNITVINNVNRGNGRGAYLRGPAAANVERFTHRPGRPVAIQASSRPGVATVQKGQLAIYRPTVRNYNAGVRPARVQDLHTIRPVNKSAAAAAPGGHPNTARQPAREPARATMPPNNRPAAQPHPEQPHPAQPRPVPQGHPVTRPDQPRQQEHPARPTPSSPQHHTMQPQQPNPQPQRPAPSRPAPQDHPQQNHPQQARPVQPQPHPQQPRPMPQQARPHPQPAQPHPAPQQRPVNRPVQPPPQQPHGNPPHEHQ